MGSRPHRVTQLRISGTVLDGEVARDTVLPPEGGPVVGKAAAGEGRRAAASFPKMHLGAGGGGSILLCGHQIASKFRHVRRSESPSVPGDAQGWHGAKRGLVAPPTLCREMFQRRERCFCSRSS